ncbi:MAG: GNAT family N-acetyltransferase [Acidimicrobiia bacterium]|nr:GNAT family N-acetyltransferase [Acidimicrobiia bacterium]
MAQYPSEYEMDVVLRDGKGVRVRPITPDDARALGEFFEKMGEESRYFRYFGVKESLSEAELKYFANVDYFDRMALVAVEGGELVAVARYDRLDDDETSAEVAFDVIDEQQGRGLGTELLQLLTNFARQRGIDTFRAFVLADNRRMMRVFRNSGYEMGRTMEDGVYSVSFPVEESEDSREAWGEREKRAVGASLLPLFVPSSVAVIGASTDPHSIGGRLFSNLLSTNLTGPLYPVNPNARVVNSVRAYDSVLDIPDQVDLAFIVVPAPLVADVLRECAEAGVRGVVVISAGFGEIGNDEGERELLDLVRSAGMRMIGPNCMGLLNTDPAVNLNGTFAPFYPPAGNVAMSSQSGALGIAILDYANTANLGISQFVSVGNKADVSGNDLLLAWEDDPNTDVILLYLESFGNPRKFSRIARRIGRKKPIAAVKSGRSEAGIRAASSHTGALASSDVAVDALFHQAGVIRVDTIEELFDVATLLAHQPIPSGDRIGIVTNSGGPGILATDALAAQGLRTPEFSEDLQEKLAKRLPPEASPRNPVDLIASGSAEGFSGSVSDILTSGEVDAVLVIYVPTTSDGLGDVARALREVQDGYDGDVTLLSVFMQADGETGLLNQGDPKRRIPSFLFPEAAAEALGRAIRHGKWRQRDPGKIRRFDDIDVVMARRVVDAGLEDLEEGGGWLEPEDVDALLDCFGISLPRAMVATDADEAVEIAADIGGPVVLKVVSSEALHKSDVGGVALEIEGEDEVRAAFEDVISKVNRADGVLVQEFVHGGHEVIVGMTQDPNFGPLVLFGLGGITVELLGDVAFRIHPLTDADTAEMVRSIKGFPLLEGYRNEPSGDIEALEETLSRVSTMISAVPEIAEMDMNPVMILEPGEGVRVVDTRIKLVPVAAGAHPEMVDLPSVPSNPRRVMG